MDKSMTYTSATLSGGYYRQNPTCPYCRSKLEFNGVNSTIRVFEVWKVGKLTWLCQKCGDEFSTPLESHFETPCPSCLGKGWYPKPKKTCYICHGHRWNRT